MPLGITWLFKWQSLVAGGLSALALLGVTLFVWWYERSHIKRSEQREKRRLAKALSLEIQTIIDRVLTAQKIFELSLKHGRLIEMPDITRPFPVYSNHTRDLALFDDVTSKNLMEFYEGLPVYPQVQKQLKGQKARPDVLEQKVPGEPETRFDFWSKKALARGGLLRKRLLAITDGTKLPDWNDELD